MRKDAGVWSIPKGEYSEGEDPFNAAKREFEEETGVKPEGDFLPLPSLKQSKKKTVKAWALQADYDAAAMRGNLFSMEWPPGPGRVERYPEVDRAEWFPLPVARTKILKGQIRLIDQLAGMLAGCQTGGCRPPP